MMIRLVVPLSFVSLSITAALASDVMLNTPQFSGIDNFRDVAGTQTAYNTSHNGIMRSGVFYRSNALTPSASDLPVFNTLGIEKVFDLRTEDEIAGTPDTLPTGARYQHIDILGNIASGSNIGSVSPTTADESIAMMQRVNAEFVNNAVMRGQFGLLFNELAATEDAALFHCTAGKDRTGWTAALLQSIAGVDSQTIMEDYLATNDYSQMRVEATLAQMPADMAAIYKPLLTVEASYLQTGLDTVQAQYGDIDNYLKNGLGLSQETIYVLRGKMVAYTTLPGQESSQGNAAAGAQLLNELQNSALSGHYTSYNYYLQSAVDAGTLGGVESRVGGQVHADSGSYLLRQPSTLDSAMQPYVAGHELENGQNKAWAHILADHLGMDGSDRIASSDEDTYGIIFGVTQRMNANLSVYGDLGYARGKVESAQGQVDTDTTFLGFGGRYGFTGLEQGFYTALGFNAGIIDYQSQREIGGGLGTARGDTRGNQIGAKAALGYVYRLPSMTLEPSVGMRVSHLRLNSFQENGSEMALKMDSVDETVTSATANLTMSVGPFQSGAWSVVPMVNLGYEHFLSSPSFSSQGQLEGYSIVQDAAFSSRNQVKGGVNLAASRGPLTLMAGGNVAGGKDNHGYSGNLTISYAF
ncbi:protein tyrosine phosphatase [Chania multitudinisentens RB-25]|uniref:Protein tyrosine phosphatase n=1 Tax=Chania multitudinisentens RB-25 TaxID=1441930 RepID=W0L421_9GAMM|nr:tyrosine-protein phosphatase [Chania multitudinisentens]AHG18426.1 protein tyrosine phosphatase [Chania multitudinisentens RB-25]